MTDGPIVYKRNETVSLASLPRRNGSDPALRIGRPVSLQPHLEIPLVREGSRNVLMVGRNDALTSGLLAACLDDLHGDEAVTVEVFDFTSAEGVVETVATARGYRVRRRREFADGVAELRRLVDTRLDDGASGELTVLVVLNGLTKARDLDPEDYSDEAQQLANDLHAIVRDGPEVGVHVLTACDSVANLSRRLDRRVQREFGIRIAFAMSSDDSQQLINSEVAGTLQDQEGLLVDLDASRSTKFQPLTLGA